MRRRLLPVARSAATTAAVSAVATALLLHAPTASAQGEPAPTGAPAPSVVIDDPMLAPPPPAPRTIASLDDGLSQVRSRSTDLRISLDQVMQAEGQSRVALAALLPSVNGTMTGTHQFITNTSSQVSGVAPDGSPTFRTFTSPQENVLNAGASLTQVLVNLRTFYALGTARRNEQAARLGLADQKRTLALSLATAMLAVLTAERVADLSRVGVRTALERLVLSRTRERLGVATALDLVRAEQDVESARTVLVTADEAVRQSREALGLAVGIPSAVGVGPGLDPDSIAASVRALCKQAPSLDERADVAASKLRAEVAARSVTDVWLQFLPSLSMQSGFSTTSADVGASPRATWNIQAVLTVPIWDGGARYGLLRSARGSADLGAQQLEALRRTSTVQVTQAHRSIEVAQQSVRVVRSTRDLAANVDRLVRNGYERGQGTSLDLVTAATGLRQAEINLALQEFALARAEVQDALSMAQCSW